MFYAYFERILVVKKNGKRNPNESYTSKYQEHVACSHGYKLICVNDYLVSFLSHTWLNMLFVILLIIQLEKASPVVN